VQDVPRSQVSSYGIATVPDFDDQSGRIRGIVEKPRPEDSPGTLAVVGRYILPASIFAEIERTGAGNGDEIQLTDAIAALLAKDARFDAFRFRGTRFDCGTHIGLIEATIRYALDHERLSDAARRLMRDALQELGIAEQ